MLEILATFIIYTAPLEELAQGPKVPGKELTLQEGKTMSVSQINFSGNTKVTTSQLQRLCKPFLNKNLSESDLFELKRRIKLLYSSKGYPNAQVTIPSKHQKGELMVVIKEGKSSL